MKRPRNTVKCGPITALRSVPPQLTLGLLEEKEQSDEKGGDKVESSDEIIDKESLARATDLFVRQGHTNAVSARYLAGSFDIQRRSYPHRLIAYWSLQAMPQCQILELKEDIPKNHHRRVQEAEEEAEALRTILGHDLNSYSTPIFLYPPKSPTLPILQNAYEVYVTLYSYVPKVKVKVKKENPPSGAPRYTNVFECVVDTAATFNVIKPSMAWFCGFSEAKHGSIVILPELILHSQPLLILRNVRVKVDRDFPNDELILGAPVFDCFRQVMLDFGMGHYEPSGEEPKQARGIIRFPHPN